MKRSRYVALLAAGMVALAACSTPAASQQLVDIRLQLQWFPQAQFAGYYVALDKGFYTEENLDVTILPGGPDIVSEQQVANGQADFGVDWVASFLAFRDKGLPIVTVAQIYQSSGLLLVSRKQAGINQAEDLKGKRVGVWYGGNEFEFLALMDKLKLDPDRDSDGVPDPEDDYPIDPDRHDGEAPIATAHLKVRRRGANATLTFSATDRSTLASFQCKLDREPWAGCGSPWLMRRLDPGRHTVRVAATDEWGNRDEVAKHWTTRGRKR